MPRTAFGITVLVSASAGSLQTLVNKTVSLLEPRLTSVTTESS